MAKESSSEPRRRPRLYLGTACDQCFRTKARCSGKGLACERCKLNKTSCTYSTGRKKATAISREERHQPDCFRMHTPSGSSTSSGSVRLVEPDPSAGPTEDHFLAGGQLPLHGDDDFQAALTLHSPRATETQPIPTSDTSHLCQRSMARVSEAEISFANHHQWPDHQNDDNSTRSDATHTIENLSSTIPEQRMCGLGPTEWLGGPQPIPQYTFPPLHPHATAIPDAGFAPIPTRNRSSSKTSSVDGNILASLHAYDLGVPSVSSADETLAQLQQSLTTVSEWVLNAEVTVGMTPSVVADALDCQPKEQRPSQPDRAQQNDLAVALFSAHTVQLVFACYAQMRRRHCFSRSCEQRRATRPDSGYSGSDELLQSETAPAWPTSDASGALHLDLLDLYITRDMRLCQSLAQRLVLCFRRLVDDERETCSAPRGPEALAAICAMIRPLETCALMAL